MSLGYEPAPPAPGEPPRFPPLLRGHAAAKGTDPFAKACAVAASGRWEAGDVWYAPDEAVLRATVLFAPDRPVEDALAMLYAAACGMNDAIGALAPPEVGVTHAWPDGIMVNGALAGRLRAAAGPETDGAPEWLAVAVTVGIAPLGADPGRRPDVTSLHEEGCMGIGAVRLMESWARHMLVWVNRYMDEGFRPLHDAWFARAEFRGEEIEAGGRKGLFVGLDETGNLLLRGPERTEAVPFATILAAPRDWAPQ